MIEKHSFDMRLTPSGVGSTIEMDGKRLDGVRAIDVRVAVGEPTRVKVEFAASRVDIVAEAELARICRKAAELVR